MSSRFWWARAPLVLVLVAVVLRLWMPGTAIFTVDELHWLPRSHHFELALEQGDFAATTIGPANEVGTRPGVTTMWVGALGERLAKVDPLSNHGGTIRYAHMLMGLLCSLLLWPFVLLTARIVGRRAALVAGALIAVEPLMVGHSAILHTDALVAMTAGTAVVAIIAAFEQLRTERDEITPRSWWKRRSAHLGVAAGFFAGLGWLTKLNAMVLLGVVTLAVIGVHLWTLLRAPRLGGRNAILTELRRESSGALVVLAVGTITFVVVAVAFWPAMWFDPISNVRATLSTSDLAMTPSRHLFLGSVVTGGDWRFYAVELWFRASPWLLISGVIAVGWKIWSVVRRRPRVVPRRIAFPLLAPAIVYLVAITVSEKQYDRYLLPLLPIAAIGIGVVAVAVARSVGHQAWVRVAGWTGFAAAGLVTASLAPYAISYVDPLVGGQRLAVRNIQLGWGEGTEVVSAEYWKLASPGHCPTWSGTGGLFILCPHVDFSWLDGNGERPRFVFRYVTNRQLGMEPAELEPYLKLHGNLVKATTIDGVRYAELWELDH